MELARFNNALLKQAISIYLELAYQDRPPRSSIVQLDFSSPRFTDIFAQFLDESKEEGGRRLQRYALRLGNQHYPFMKFVLQEFVQPGFFYFAVDTHDEMKISPDVPGYDEFLQVRAYNRNLKCTIEIAWSDRGLPTMQNLQKELADAAGSVAGDRPDRARVLVIDDDEALAGVMEAILVKHGYAVAKAHDGPSGLQLVDRSHFDLVICDYQMPEMDGGAFCEALRARQQRREVPVLLTTAAAISLAEITDKAHGFLVKPYREEVLLGLIDNLLEKGSASGAEAP